MNVICSADFKRRDATRFAFGVFKPALKRGPTLNCRYRGKVKPVVGKALDWKRGPTLNCRYRGKVKPVIEKALDWRRASSLDCRIAVGVTAAPPEECSVAALIHEVQCF
jgi:hypothetical protein